MVYHKELLLKERIRFLWEQILSFKRSSHFEKGRVLSSVMSARLLTVSGTRVFFVN